MLRTRGVEVLLVVGVAHAGTHLEVGRERVVHIAEQRPALGVLVLHRVAVLRVTGREAVVVEAVDLQVFLEVVGAGDPLQRIARGRLQAEFLRQLGELGDTVGGLRVEGHQRSLARIAGAVRDAGEAAAEPAVHVTAADVVGLVVTGDGVQRHGVEVPAQARADGRRLQSLVVVAVGRVIAGVETVHQVVGAALHDVGAEGGGMTVVVAPLQLEEGVEAAVLVAGLHARGLVAEAFQVAGGVGQRVVHAVILTLHHARGAQRPVAAHRHVHRRLQVLRVPAPQTQAGIALEALAGLDRIELHDAGRRVAAEQRALRATQQFNLLDVEEREALQDRVLLHHVVEHQAHGLRGVEVEVGVAQTAHIEAREAAAEVRLDVQARHAARDGANVLARHGHRLDGLALHGRDGERHFLQVLDAARTGHDDLLELLRVFLRFGLRLGAGIQGGNRKADATGLQHANVGHGHELHELKRAPLFRPGYQLSVKRR